MADTRNSAPILEALATYTKQSSVSFGVRGHKSGQGAPLAQAAGHVAAEMVAPYTPGIPRLVPGQRIEEVHVAFLRLGMEAGLFPAGLRDPDMRSLRVVA